MHRKKQLPSPWTTHTFSIFGTVSWSNFGCELVLPCQKHFPGWTWTSWHPDKAWSRNFTFCFCHSSFTGWKTGRSNRFIPGDTGQIRVQNMSSDYERVLNEGRSVCRRFLFVLDHDSWSKMEAWSWNFTFHLQDGRLGDPTASFQETHEKSGSETRAVTTNEGRPITADQKRKRILKAKFA